MHLTAWLQALLLLPIASCTFQDPENTDRIKFRYWLPDASVNTTTVQNDIRSASSIGAGGVELLPLYNYGGSLAAPPSGADWATYGFGTEAYSRVLKASLQAAKDAGVVFDFSLGPNQGQGVPAETTDRGLHWDLVCFLGESRISRLTSNYSGAV